MNSLNNNVLDQNGTMTSTETNSVKSVCCGIYGLRNKTTGKWYVGYSKNIYKRWEVYDKISCKTQPKIYRALKLYGVDDFEKVILEECSKDSLGDREIYWISRYDSVNNGYNLTSGGTGGDTRLGASCSTVHKRNISDAKRGKPLSPTHIENLRKAWKKRVMSEEELRMRQELGRSLASRRKRPSTTQ